MNRRSFLRGALSFAAAAMAMPTQLTGPMGTPAVPKGSDTIVQLIRQYPRQALAEYRVCLRREMDAQWAQRVILERTPEEAEELRDGLREGFIDGDGRNHSFSPQGIVRALEGWSFEAFKPDPWLNEALKRRNKP